MPERTFHAMRWIPVNSLRGNNNRSLEQGPERRVFPRKEGMKGERFFVIPAMTGLFFSAPRRRRRITLATATATTIMPNGPNTPTGLAL